MGIRFSFFLLEVPTTPSSCIDLLFASTERLTLVGRIDGYLRDDPTNRPAATRPMLHIMERRAQRYCVDSAGGISHTAGHMFPTTTAIIID